MVEFRGQHEHTLDDKGRLIIPIGYREPIQDGLFLTNGMDRCLWVFPLDTWEFISAKLRNQQLPYRQARRLQRLLWSGVDSSLDRQGRLLIPSSLRSYSGLTPGSPVVILGVQNRLELWSPERWREEIADLGKGGDEMERYLKELGI